MKKSELRQIIREEINKLNKKPINEGIISNLITKIVMFTLSGKAKQIDGLISQTGRKDLMKASQEFQKSVQRYRDFVNRPDVKKDLEKAGIKPEDTPFYNMD
ncbi:MAG: hypothetical protein JETCAE03_33200 [Ignavibacteriaceae bacterium]|jgi:hypothetical protein|nr:MAG: hypothetical protein JETCAE03_33200 [Ignavibacteriaceae bacterium]